MPAAVQSVAERLRRNVERVLVGKRATIELAIVALLCEGHLLIEDVPGIGKTTLARSMARSIGGTFRRLQCTPDLLPSDVTGVSVFDQRTSQFEFRPQEDVRRYLVQVTRATRADTDVRLGASPRATLALQRASLAWAAMQGRDFVVPDDIKYLAVPVLAHRLIASLEARLRGRDAVSIVEGILDTVPVPVEPARR